MRDWRMSDGYVLRGRIWPPRRPASSAFLYLHGIQSHGGWFERSASLLAETGCAVLLPDRRGSGLNEVGRGDTPGAQRWLLDLDELGDALIRESGCQRVAVAGVSWGGKLALLWALQRPRLVERLLLVAPGLFPAVDPGWLARARIAASLLRGGRRAFPIPLNDPALFTDNPAGREFIQQDPLRLIAASARFFYSSRRIDVLLARAKRGSLAVPTTALLAERDRIIRNDPTEKWLRRVARDGPDIKYFTGAEHTLEFGVCPAAFEEALTRWASAGTDSPRRGSARGV